MQYDVPLDQSIAVLKRVLPLMSKQQIPTIPQNYAVWYQYATHADDKLCAEIEKLVKTGTPFDADTCKRLYEDHFSEAGEKETEAVRVGMRDMLSSLLGQLGELGSDLGDFAGVLDGCSQELGEDIAPEELKLVVAGLVEETRKAREKSIRVEDSLQSMASELEELREQVKSLSRDSMTDALTGVANRRAFDDALSRLIDEARESGTSLCLVMADIDHFKSFNDRHGHLVGDQVIKFVAQEIKQCVKGRDMVARYGGEEFALLLPETQLASAVMLAESIRAIVDAQPVKDGETGDVIDRVTISMGVAEVRASDKPETIIERADQALYASKSAGRNCVTSEADAAKAVA